MENGFAKSCNLSGLGDVVRFQVLFKTSPTPTGLFVWSFIKMSPRVQHSVRRKFCETWSVALLAAVCALDLGFAGPGLK